ncbi:MAG: hypothetical protein AVDCRST_MAG40-1026, partial [uncultured Gemmatimonadaceae bacterium]
ATRRRRRLSGAGRHGGSSRASERCWPTARRAHPQSSQV